MILISPFSSTFLSCWYCCSSNICIDMCSLFQDGWVGFKAVLLKKRLTAADFYNGYLHQTAEGLFVSRKRPDAHQMRENSTLWRNGDNFLPWCEHCRHDIYCSTLLLLSVLRHLHTMHLLYYCIYTVYLQ